MVEADDDHAEKRMALTNWQSHHLSALIPRGSPSSATGSTSTTVATGLLQTTGYSSVHLSTIALLTHQLFGEVISFIAMRL